LHPVTGDLKREALQCGCHVCGIIDWIRRGPVQGCIAHNQGSAALLRQRGVQGHEQGQDE
jgi:hypothetical protein